MHFGQLGGCLLLVVACWPSLGLAATEKACEYLEPQAIAVAVGSLVSKPVEHTLPIEGAVLHMCEWAVQGTQRGKVVLSLRDAPTKAMNEQGAKELRSAPHQAGLHRQLVTGLGDVAEYAFWETEPRAGITVLTGTRSVNITVLDVARYGPSHRQAFVALARTVLAKK